jgi:hypothetical protein
MTKPKYDRTFDDATETFIKHRESVLSDGDAPALIAMRNLADVIDASILEGKVNVSAIQQYGLAYRSLNERFVKAETVVIDAPDDELDGMLKGIEKK